MTKLSLTVLMAWVIGAQFGVAHSQQASTVTSVLETVRAKYGLPSLAGGIIKGGKLTQTGVTGRLSLEGPALAQPSSQYQLGSLSKSFTAVVIARLIERGQLNRDSKLGEVLPDLPMLPAYRTVTVDDLLAHVAGLPREGDRKASTREEYVKAALAQTRQGGKFAYSNAGYVALTLMAEKVSGKSWPDLLQTEVFGPLGLSGCQYGLAPDDGISPLPHRYTGSQIKASALGSGSAPIYAGAGLVRCDMNSYGKYALAQLDEDRSGTHFLTSDSWKHLHRDSYSQGYGGGWGISKNSKGVMFLEHTGSDGYNYSAVLLSPEQGAGVYVFTNVGFDEKGNPDRADKAVREAMNALQNLLRQR